MKWFSILQLMRPANIVTSIADILSGIAIAGFLVPEVWTQEIITNILLLVVSTSGLYAGGIVFNDVFDIKKDRISRPERVIPSGRVTVREAKIVGLSLFSIGISAALLVSGLSGILAIAIALLALLYDKFAKHHKVLGPLNMGICRGVNLILGMSIHSQLTANYWLIGIIPIIFIAAITLTAQKETEGKNKAAIGFAMLLDLMIVIGFVLMSLYLELSLLKTSVFLTIWYAMNAISKAKALVQNNPKFIQKAVKMGIISLIPLNASYVAGFSSIFMAVLVMGLLPLSLFLSKKFPVT
jgi:4-hydroxybenzoate polyprenyltransferase|tara:strand:- start:19716 stop:20606 length:891 start_codon:yes stop_codon:yes gene_type:complete